MLPDRDRFLRRVKARLAKVYGERLAGIVLYGSEARGDAEEDSDIDIFVLLNREIELSEDLWTIITSLYDLQLEVFRPIHAMPVNSADFNEGGFAVFRNAQEEGVFL
ncbi:nucleotidyltransferase domain-containing protein [bacterium]|nr:nucleotidyltransferase domain-containing protein [bacterium]